MSDNLPPLPNRIIAYDTFHQRLEAYSADQMQAYAIAAVEADRVSRDVPEVSSSESKQTAAATQAMTDFEVTKSIIYECPALRLPQSFLEKLGMTAQIVALKGATPEIAAFIAAACNHRTESLANQGPVAWHVVHHGSAQIFTSLESLDLTDCVTAPLYTSPQPQPVQVAQPRLTVRLTSFPESNGKRNWTALLVRAEKWGGLIGNCGGITVDRGEMWNRVAYEAECARFLIGERDTEPHILDYGDDIETPEQWLGEVRGGRQRVQPKAAPLTERVGLLYVGGSFDGELGDYDLVLDDAACDKINEREGAAGRESVYALYAMPETAPQKDPL